MALQVVLHENPGAMPQRIAIGTVKAFRNGYDYRYEKHIMSGHGSRCLYVCDTPTETGLPGEKIFIISDGEYWYACEGTVEAGRFDVRQACFRTKASFWEADWHAWEINGSRHDQPGRQYADGQWTSGSWSGELQCETRQNS